MATLVGQTVSHYKILEKLGEGGMGVVYKAEDLKLDRPVALKFLSPDLLRDPQARRRFIHEAKAASALQHNNICTVHDVDETDDGALFIVLDLYDGETLKEKIERGPLQFSEAIDLAVQIAQGLSDAHRAGIIHRDVKPANIRITKNGIAKILDFGLAKLGGQTLLTKAGSTIGTAAYMSPEQATGENLDERTDIWSFGVVLYEMLAGQRPFKAEYENALIYAILNVDPKPLSSLRADVPPEVEHVVARCLARNAEERYRHMEEIIADLRSWPEGALTTPPPRQQVHPTGPGRTRKRILRNGLAISAVLALGLLGYVLFWPGREVGLPDARLKMIAVLPFENLGAAEDEYFADGLTEEITSRLSAVRSLGVISRTSAMQYKRTGKSLRVIASELGVDYILEGSVRWVKADKSQRIRITPQLIQASGDRHLWADNIDRTIDDVFSVQTEIATRVVEVLGVVMLADEKGAVEAIPTKNIDAYKAFLEAGSSGYYERPKLERSIAMYERAVALDSTFALAHLALSMAHLHYYFFGYDRSSERLARTKEQLDRAFALQPDLPQAYLALGFYYYLGHLNYERALDAFEAAGKKLPNSNAVLCQTAYIWRRQGKFEEAAERLKLASRLDPNGAGTVREIGLTLSYLGNYSEAETWFDRAISLSPDQGRTFDLKSDMYLRWRGDTKKSRLELERAPTAYSSLRRLTWLDIYERRYESALTRLAKIAESAIVEQEAITPVPQLRGFLYRLMGDTSQALASFDTARVYLEAEIAERPNDHRLYLSMGMTLAGLGRKTEAIQATRNGIELLPLSKDRLGGAFPLLSLAQVYTLIGNEDAAVDQIESLLRLHAPKLLTIPLLRLDPIYDPLRANPRFEALLAKHE